MPAQAPLGASYEVFRGRQIFIDDINDSKARLSSSAYSPPFLLPDSNEAQNPNVPNDIPYVLDLPVENVTNTNFTWSSSSNNTFWPFSIDMQHLVFVAMCLCFVTLVLLIIVALKLRHIYLRWRRGRRAGPRIAIIEAEAAAAAQTPQCHNNSRRGLLSRMLARIEEFDSLTPLIVTPNSLSDDDHVPMQPARVTVRHASADRVSTATNTASNTPVSFRGSPRRRPRCAAGKVTLFPLASNARKAEIYTSEVGSDSGDSVRAPLNNAYTKGPVTTANGNVVMRNPFEDLDLVSIDRTSGASTLDRRATPNDLLGLPNNVIHDSSAAAALALANKPDQQSDQRQYQQQSLTAVAASSAGDVYPLSTLPSPASTDILIPVSELHSSAPNLNRPNSAPGNNKHRVTNGNNHYRFVIKRESTSVDSLNSNLSSPMDSSICGDTGSPLDTTGSVAELSDSVYMASESENSEVMKNGSGRVYSLDTGSSQRWYTVAAGSGGEGSDRSEPDVSTFEYEPAAAKRYVLHRIEEESIDDVAAAGTTATSSTTPADRDYSKRSDQQLRSSNDKKQGAQRFH